MMLQFLRQHSTLEHPQHLCFLKQKVLYKIQPRCFSRMTTNFDLKDNHEATITETLKYGVMQCKLCLFYGIPYDVQILYKTI